MRLHLYWHYLTWDIIDPKKDSIDAMPEGQALPEPNREVNRGGCKGTRRIKTRLSGNSRVDPVRIRKINPQMAQRVVIFIFRPLYVTLCPLWFSETLFRTYQKVSQVLVTAT